jgi:hypothetical protein
VPGVHAATLRLEPIKYDAGYAGAGLRQVLGCSLEYGASCAGAGFRVSFRIESASCAGRCMKTQGRAWLLGRSGGPDTLIIGLHMYQMLHNSIRDLHQPFLTTLQCCCAEWLSRKVDRISLCVLIVAYVAILIAVLVS